MRICEKSLVYRTQQKSISVVFLVHVGGELGEGQHIDDSPPSSPVEQRREDSRNRPQLLHVRPPVAPSQSDICVRTEYHQIMQFSLREHPCWDIYLLDRHGNVIWEVEHGADLSECTSPGREP